MVTRRSAGFGFGLERLRDTNSDPETADGLSRKTFEGMFSPDGPSPP